MYEITHLGATFKVKLLKWEYANNRNLRVGLVLENGEPYRTLSVNTDRELPITCFVFKNYSENEGLLEEFERLGVVKQTGQFVKCGHVDCPIVELLK